MNPDQSLKAYQLLATVLLTVLLAHGIKAQNVVHVSVNTGVNSSGCGTSGSPCATIQYAVDSIALSHDTVKIDTGEYALATTVSGFIPVVQMPEGKSLHFKGSKLGQGTRINGGVSRRGFTYLYTGTGCSTGSANDGISDSLVFTFKDLIIEDCNITEMCGSISYAYGGGIRIDADSSSTLQVSITDCIFRNNRAYDTPGTFAGGRSSSGGAVFIYGRRTGVAGQSYYAEAHITGCDFNGNYANQNWNGGHGGAVLLRDLDTASVINSSFCSNYTFSQSADNGDLQHDRNAGGAICFYDMYNGSPGHKYTVDSCTFINNSATTNNGSGFTFKSEGGAIFLTKGDVLTATNSATVKISNSNFYNNFIEPGIEHIDKNGGTIDTASIGFNAFYDQFEVDLGEDTILCLGDSLWLDAQLAGGIYTWSDGSTGPGLLVNDSGIYSVTVTVGSCTVADTIEIEIQDYPIIDLGNDTTLCPFDSLELDAYLPGASYLWSTGDTTSSIFTGEASVISVLVSIHGCASGDTIVIDTVELWNVVLGPDTILCPNVTMIADANTPGATYLWQNGSTDSAITISQAGTYHVNIAKEGCIVSDTLNVSYVAQINDIIGGDRTACQTDTVWLEVSQSNLDGISWSNGSSAQAIQVLTSGTYAVTINDRGCLFYDSVDVFFKPLPVVSLGPDTSACQGSVIWLNVYNENATYTWSHNNFSGYNFPVAVSGTYAVTVTLDGCSVSDYIKIDIHPIPELNLTANEEICEGDSVLLIPSTVLNPAFLWNDGSTEDHLMVYQSGVYTVTVTKKGCSNQASVEVMVHEVPKVELGPDSRQCEGEELTLFLNDPLGDIMWSDGSSDSMLTVSKAGKYWVRLISNGCTASDTFRYHSKPLPWLEEISDTVICLGDEIYFEQKDSSSIFIWNELRHGSSLMVSEPGTYIVKGRNDCGVVRDTFVVDAVECSCLVYVPNAFTPASNGLNDHFSISYTCDIEDFRFIVFDRWGKKLFETDQADFAWDGSHAGRLLPIGVYAYVLRYQPAAGLADHFPPSVEKRGMINLVR